MSEPIKHTAIPVSECQHYPGPYSFPVAEFEHCFHLLVPDRTTYRDYDEMQAAMRRGDGDGYTDPQVCARVDYMADRERADALWRVKGGGHAGTHHHLCADCYRKVFGTE